MSPLYYLEDLKDRIKYAFQRAFRGFDDTAYWGLCEYVQEITIKVLKKTLTDTVGYPIYLHTVYPELIPKELRKKWVEIQKKIIEGFELDLNCADCIKMPNKKDQKKIDEAAELFGKYFYCFWA